MCYLLPALDELILFLNVMVAAYYALINKQKVANGVCLSSCVNAILCRNVLVWSAPMNFNHMQSRLESYVSADSLLMSFVNNVKDLKRTDVKVPR